MVIQSQWDHVGKTYVYIVNRVMSFKTIKLIDVYLGSGRFADLFLFCYERDFNACCLCQTIIKLILLKI